MRGTANRLVGESEGKLSSQIYHMFAGNDVSKLRIVEQGRNLERAYDTNFTGDILMSADSCGSIKKNLLSADIELRVKGSNTHQSLKHLSAKHSEISWLKVWDMVLDHGMRGPRAALRLFSTLSRLLFGDRLCTRWDISIAEDLTYLEH